MPKLITGVAFVVGLFAVEAGVHYFLSKTRWNKEKDTLKKDLEDLKDDIETLKTEVSRMASERLKTP